MKETSKGWNSIRGDNVWNFSGIPNTVSPKELESFDIHGLEKIGIKLNKSQIGACHRLGKSERTIVKFLKRKDAENILANKKKSIVIGI